MSDKDSSEDIPIPEMDGQDVSSAPEEQGQALLFPFEHTFRNGNEPTVFQTEKELRDYLNDGTLRQGRFTQRMQELAEQDRAHKEAVKKFEEEQRALGIRDSRYSEWDRRMKENPQLFEQIRTIVEGQGKRAPQNNPEIESFRKEFEEFRDQMEERAKEEENERLKAEVYKELQGEYEDFDQEQVEELLTDLQSTRELGPKEILRKMSELLYFAKKGQSNPAKLEKQITEKLKGKAQATSPMPSRGEGKTEKGLPEGATFDELAQIAKREMGVE